MRGPSQNFNIWTHFNLKTTLCSRNYDLYFTDEKTEVQIGLPQVTLENGLQNSLNETNSTTLLWT